MTEPARLPPVTLSGDGVRLEPLSPDHAGGLIEASADGDLGALNYTATPMANAEAMADYIRDAAVTYWHQSCTARMGRDAMAVVDGALKVYGIDGLRVADASILPRVTTGNTQAPCAVIGERAAEILKRAHGL